MNVHDISKMPANAVQKTIRKDQLKRPWAYDYDTPIQFERVRDKTTKSLSIEEKIMNIMKDPEKNKNFMSNMRRVTKENKKRYK